MKLQEIREKTIDELKDVVLNLKKELFSLRMKHNKINQLENTAQIKNTKRAIAQAKTVIREKELKEIKNA
ncbi:MAG: 50S ribosomal protein L29 [Cyanobacteria bacterium SIG30]|nr:50S ribosomal protein L29 [Cyanobacteria bacterium SIG30]